MNKRRLLKLADLLEEDAANAKGVKFDLRVVACHAKKHKQAPTSPYDDGRYFRPGERPTLDCGTAAGAVGIAVLSGAFKRQGFTYQIDPDDGLVPVFGEVTGFGFADQSFFELTVDEQHFLFHPASYSGRITGARGEMRVAKRIRWLLAVHGPKSRLRRTKRQGRRVGCSSAHS